MATWRDRLKEILKERPDLSMKSLSLKAGLSESGVRDILSRGVAPTVETFIAIASAAGVPPGWLLNGDERLKIQIPLVGYASGGEGWTPFHEDAVKGTHDQVEFELGDHDVIAIEIRGDSMAPVYRDHDVLFCQRRAAHYAHNLIGCDCVVRTSDDQHFVKILKKGSRPGRFNLKSYNPVFDDIEDVQLAWAAPIVWIKRGGR